MKYVYIFLIIFVLKILHDFFLWIYGYFLRIKWVSYFKTENKNYISYTYQTEKYLNSVPNVCICGDLYLKSLAKENEKEFIKSHGYYKYRLLQNINPFYWLKLVIFLPQNIIRYLGLRTKNQTVKFFNIIWWLSSILFTIYNDEITSFLKELIKSLFEYFSK